MSNKYYTVGKAAPRKDAVPKVTGQEKFTSDVVIPGMLYGRALRSPYPHAKVKKIDTSKAEAMGAVCVTFKEVPQVKYNERIVSVPSATFKDKTVLTDEPLQVGEAIAAVAAETEEKAEQALKLIDVEYEKLEAIFDPIAAMSPGKPNLHDHIVIEGKKVEIKNNVAVKVDIAQGDVEKGFKESDLVIERESKIGRAYHTQLETKSAVCVPEPNGGITAWTTTQSIHNCRILLGEIFGIPLNKVNIKKIPIGGSFGSSIHMNPILPICVALALKSKKPVKMVSTREEDMYDHCRYPTIAKLKLGAKKDGTLVAAEVEAIVDIGSHNIQAYPYIGCMAGWLVSLYKMPNLKYTARAVYTNKVPTCAMQGFGNPQINIIAQSMMNEIAEKFNLDPVDVELKNYVGLGDIFWGQGPTVKSVIKSCGVEELIKKGSEMIGWKNRGRPQDKKGEIRRGIGMARGFHTSSAGGPLPGEAIDYSGAMIKINEDGTVDVVMAMMDMGGGALEAGLKIVAEALGVPLDNVELSPTDTRTSVYDVAQHATRGVYAGGGTMKKVAEQVRAKLLDYASRILSIPAHALKIRPDEKIGQGIIYVEGVPGKEITVKEVAATARFKDWGTIAAVDSLRQVQGPPAFTLYFVEVEVNTKTGEVKPVRAVIGADCGTVIDPIFAEAQVHGGFHRGLSYVLLEDTKYKTKTGELTNKGFLSGYNILNAQDMPDTENVKVFFANTYEESGPFGAKGIGEAAINAVPPVIVNAIYNAIGIWLRDAPITPDKVLKALKEKEGE
ncbi:MAG: xanthine dehydrogenase family protein molybdopterin-binding subunit [Methanobacteriota archaeon]